MPLLLFSIALRHMLLQRNFVTVVYVKMPEIFILVPSRQRKMSSSPLALKVIIVHFTFFGVIT